MAVALCRHCQHRSKRFFVRDCRTSFRIDPYCHLPSSSSPSGRNAGRDQTPASRSSRYRVCLDCHRLDDGTEVFVADASELFITTVPRPTVQLGYAKCLIKVHQFQLWCFQFWPAKTCLAVPAHTMGSLYIIYVCTYLGRSHDLDLDGRATDDKGRQAKTQFRCTDFCRYNCVLAWLCAVRYSQL